MGGHEGLDRDRRASQRSTVPVEDSHGPVVTTFGRRGRYTLGEYEGQSIVLAWFAEIGDVDVTFVALARDLRAVGTGRSAGSAGCSVRAGAARDGTRCSFDKPEQASKNTEGDPPRRAYLMASKLAVRTHHGAPQASHTANFFRSSTVGFGSLRGMSVFVAAGPEPAFWSMCSRSPWTSSSVSKL